MGGVIAFERVAFQFKAFISYSHEDEKWAERLQTKLETYRVDKALRGVPTPVGPVPATLHPIFRDRRDLAAGASLSKKLRSALDSSQFLIVVCSPAAAASDYVNEEIRYFRRQGHGERILTFIVGGEPSPPISNCFPPALLQTLRAKDDDGDAAGDDPLAADARAVGDGFEIAHLKLAAGLLGLPLDVLVQRQQERQTKERFWWRTAAATLAVIATVAVGSAYYSWRTTQRANLLINGSIRSTAQLVQTTSRVRDDMGVSAKATIELLNSIEHLFNEFESYDVHNPRARLQRAEMLLDFARNYGKLKHTKEQERTANQALAKIEGLREPAEILEAVLTLRAEAHRQRGDAYHGDGKFELALREFDDGLKVSDDAYSERSVLGPKQFVARAKLLLGRAVALAGLNKKTEALAAATQSVSMGKELPLDYRNENDRQAAEILIDARYLTADLIRQLNDPRRDLDVEAYINEGLQSAERLSQYSPERVGLQRQIARMYLARGDLRRWRADRPGALEDYRLARKHREAVMKADASDLTIKAEFAFSLIKTGEEFNALRKTDEAIAELEIAEKLYGELLSERPHDPSFQHWLWTTLQGLGNAHSLSKSPKAIDYHRKKLSIARVRYGTFPGGISSLLSLAESHLDYGDAIIARGNVEDGLDILAAARNLLKPMVDDPTVDWRLLRLQARVLEGTARGKLVMKEYAEALQVADEAFALRERDRVRTGRVDPHGQAELAENRRVIGSIHLGSAKCAEAKDYYEKAVLILDRLVKQYDTPSPEWLEKYGAARKSLAAINWKDGTFECCDEPVDPKVRDMIAMAKQLVVANHR